MLAGEVEGRGEVFWGLVSGSGGGEQGGGAGGVGGFRS